MDTIVTKAIERVETLAVGVAGRGMVAVVTGGHGSGKSEAAAWVEQFMGSEMDYGRVLLIDCPRDCNAFTLAKKLAEAMGLALKGNANPISTLASIKSALIRGDYRLIIADNTDHLDEDCQEHLIRLIDQAASATKSRTGLLALETPRTKGKSFSNFAVDFGYRPLGVALPRLTRNEVGAFLTGMFPSAEGLAEYLTTDEGKQLLHDLRAYSKGAPRQVENILESIQLTASFPEIPTAEDIHKAVKGVCGGKAPTRNRAASQANGATA